MRALWLLVVAGVLVSVNINNISCRSEAAKIFRELEIGGPPGILIYNANLYTEICVEDFIRERPSILYTPKQEWPIIFS